VRKISHFRVLLSDKFIGPWLTLRAISVLRFAATNEHPLDLLSENSSIFSIVFAGQEPLLIHAPTGPIDTGDVGLIIAFYTRAWNVPVLTPSHPGMYAFAKTIALNPPVCVKEYHANPRVRLLSGD
jgi:hypothetical protein